MSLGADYPLILHGTRSEPETGYPIGQANSTDYSMFQLDFGPQGVPTPSSPMLGRTVPSAPTMNPGGDDTGVHVIVTTAYGSADSACFPVTVNIQVSNDGTNWTNSKIVGTRSFTLAQFQVAGADYFVRITDPSALSYEYLRVQFVQQSGQTNHAGYLYMYLGYDSAGSI